jgi:hypothetical protein
VAGGGVVTFACDGTINLANTITNVVDTTLDASGRQITISGSNAVRVFYINTNVSFTALNLTIADAKSQGGSAILNLGGTANLSGVLFRSNTALPYTGSDDPSRPSGGGAIFNRGGAVNASNCSFVGNTAQHSDSYPSQNAPVYVYGGAIRNAAGQVDLRSCVFVGNQAFGETANPNYFISSVPGSTCRGGAIHNSGTVMLDLCSLAGNSATGGARASFPPGNGHAGAPGGEGSGGAIFNEGTMTTDRSTLSGNSATGGSGGPGGAGIVMITLNGSPGGTGGAANGAAICNLGSLWITRSTVVSNVVTGGVGGRGGGGVQANDTGGSGASGGTGGSGLGGALLNSGVASLVNCTIGFNAGSGGAGGAGGDAAGSRYGGAGGAGGNGGSGFGGVDGTCDLTNCTVAWNLGQGGSGSAGGLGAGFVQHGTDGPPGTSGAAWGGTACGPLVNTLIASNTPPDGDSFADPKLGPLADNGGPTLSMALLPGSPAIDAGNTSLAPATDQRGFPRPAGLAADIGAFEYGSVVLWPPQVSTSPATDVSTNSAALNGTVNPIGWPTTAWFQWGATTNYGNLTPATDLGSGISKLPFSAQLAGLTPNVTYHFRIAATNDYELGYGSDQSFTSTLSSDFTYTITNGTVTITGYVGRGGTVAIPVTINGLPVTTIGAGAFVWCSGLTNVLIPASVTNLEITAFQGCPNLAAITVDALNLVYSSVDGVLFNKSRTILIECPQGKGPSYTIPNGTTSIGEHAFYGCSSLTNVSIPNSVTSIGDYAFYYCPGLTGVYFAGNATSLGGSSVFNGDNLTTVYYLPGTTGWGTTFGGRPTALWYLPNPLILTSGPSFGVQSNGFGFIISWATNLPVVVEACSNPANHRWSPVQTNALTSGWSYFSDPQWANYPVRLYRVRWP